MGVNISALIEPRSLELEDLRSKGVAIDAHNVIYQFLSIIRQPDGTPLKDEQGRVTSHLSGLLNRNANLLESGISPCYVFDGRPHELKADTIEERRDRRAQALEDWRQAQEEGDLERAFSKASQSSRLTSDILESSRELLQRLGIPIVDAPGEGEAQAAHMSLKGDIYAAGSQDYDTLLFGAPRLVRNVASTGRRRLPGGRGYKTVSVELIELDELLDALGIDRAQLVDMSIMIGTDFNDGIHGIGPKRGLKLILEHGDLPSALKSIGQEIEHYQEIRDIFLGGSYAEDYDLRLTRPDRDAVKELLCEEHGFAPGRVDSALNRIETALDKEEDRRRQRTLDQWF